MDGHPQSQVVAPALVHYSNPSLFQESSPSSQHDTTAPRSPAITNRPKKPTPTRSPYLMRVRRNAMGEKKFSDPTKAESAPDHGAAKRDSGFPFLGSGYQPLELDRPILGVVRSCSSRPCCPAKFGGRAHKGPRPPCLAVPFGLDKDRPSIPPGRSVTRCSFGAQTGLRSVSRDVCLSMPLLSIRIKLLL